MSRTSGHSTYVPRRVFDTTVDRLKEKLGQQKDRIVSLEKKIRQIEDFFEIGPHQAAWLTYLNKDSRFTTSRS